MAALGGSGAAVATAGVALAAPGPGVAFSAGLAASGVVPWALAGEADAEVSVFLVHALRATAPQSAKTVKTFWIMVSLYFTSPAPWTQEEGWSSRIANHRCRNCDPPEALAQTAR